MNTDIIIGAVAGFAAGVAACLMAWAVLDQRFREPKLSHRAGDANATPPNPPKPSDRFRPARGCVCPDCRPDLYPPRRANHEGNDTP